MSEFPHDPFNKYLFRREDCDRLYFGVTKMLMYPPTPVLEDVKSLSTYTLVYDLIGHADGWNVYKFRGAQ